MRSIIEILDDRSPISYDEANLIFPNVWNIDTIGSIDNKVINRLRLDLIKVEDYYAFWNIWLDDEMPGFARENHTPGDYFNTIKHYRREGDLNHVGNRVLFCSGDRMFTREEAAEVSSTSAVYMNDAYRDERGYVEVYYPSFDTLAKMLKYMNILEGK